MCKIYNLSNFEIIKSVYIYSILPYINSAIISSIGIAWKASSAAEVLSVPKYSIGKYLFYAKANLEPTELFSWTIIIVTLSYLLETVFIKMGRSYDKIK
jgi:NitT/TauT family transport system permease protein